MKTKWILITMLAAGLAVAAQARTSMHVQVREGQLRERPSYLGAVVTQVEYGDRVSVQREQGPWRLVTFGGQEGWIHESALTRQRIQLAAGDKDVAGAASEEEMALAGKGFNAEVEAKFRSQNQEIDFTWVDRLETMGVEPAKLTRFLEEGGLTPTEGGRR